MAKLMAKQHLELNRLIQVLACNKIVNIIVVSLIR